MFLILPQSLTWRSKQSATASATTLWASSNRSSDSLTYTKPLVTKGEVVDKITTGEDGKGESNKSLYIGKYIVEEIKGAWNHIKGDTIY